MGNTGSEVSLPRLPPGLRFHPTEEELVGFYLRRKNMGSLAPDEDWVIPEADLVTSEPWEVAENSGQGKEECVVFWRYQCKYSKTSRAKRCTPQGYWKATGLDRPVVVANRKVGMRKSLVYYLGKPPAGEKTKWLMYEYRLEGVGDSRQGEYVVCKLIKRTGTRYPFQFAQPAREGGKVVEGGETRTLEFGGFSPPLSPVLVSCPSLTSQHSRVNSPTRQSSSTGVVTEEPCVSELGVGGETHSSTSLCVQEDSRDTKGILGVRGEQAWGRGRWMEDVEWCFGGGERDGGQGEKESQDFSWSIKDVKKILQG